MITPLSQVSYVLVTLIEVHNTLARVGRKKNDLIITGHNYPRKSKNLELETIGQICDVKSNIYKFRLRCKMSILDLLYKCAHVFGLALDLDHE